MRLISSTEKPSLSSLTDECRVCVCVCVCAVVSVSECRGVINTGIRRPRVGRLHTKYYTVPMSNTAAAACLSEVVLRLIPAYPFKPLGVTVSLLTLSLVVWCQLR
jgi:hypothetical protein